MSHAKNKLNWCLEKAKKELEEKGTHRGLVKLEPDKLKAREFMNKAEHYIQATSYLKEGNFSDIGISTIFYAMYHCLLGIAAKFGYFSRNQECTFTLIYYLIEDGKIDLEKSILDKISSLKVDKKEEKTSIEIREEYQYGTETSVKEEIYQDLFFLAKELFEKARNIIEVQ